MPDQNDSIERMRKLRCCLLIPTYNNDRTLEQVIRRAQAFAADILVVNDGSTDRTAQILATIPGIITVSIAQNQGKGNALRTGFRKALELGFRYAVTLDSDNQHDPADIPAFLSAIEEHPDSLIVGARNMDQGGIPGGSSFGHKFSIFWFKVETGLKVGDVQSGYRLYPLEKICPMRFYTRRFEFEVEVMVRSAWHGIRILNVPVKVYYPPKGERVTHFRKFRDFGRATVLNTLFVFWAIFWVKPVTLFKDLRQKSWKEFFNEYIVKSRDSNFKIAASVALGATFSSLPIWGWQMVAAVTAAYALRLNKFIALLFSNLSIPPAMPVILFLSYLTGGWVLGNSLEGISYSNSITLKWIEQNLVQYLIGSVSFGVLLGLSLGIISYILLLIFRRSKPKPQEA